MCRLVGPVVSAVWIVLVMSLSSCGVGESSTASIQILAALNEGDMSFLDSVVPQRRSDVEALLSALEDDESMWSLAASRHTGSGKNEAVKLVNGNGLGTVLISIQTVGDYLDVVTVPLRDMGWYVEQYPHVAVVIQSADPECHPLHSSGRVADAVPLASTSKLVVLAAVGDLLDGDGTSMSTELTVDDSTRSLPSGSWHMLPEGTIVTLEEGVQQSYTYSDNTATDLLVELVGREATATLSTSFLESPVDHPFLKTSEVFTLNWSSRSLYGDYVSGSLDDRLSILNNISAQPLPSIEEVISSDPWIPTVGWTGTLTGFCRLWQNLLAVDEFSGVLRDGTSHLELSVLGLESVVGKGGYAPDVSSFTGIGELDCGARIVVSTAVAGAPLDPWSATAVLYQTFEVVEDEIKEMLCVS